MIARVPIPETQWRLEYLNDDESQLEQTEGLARGRGVVKFGFSFVGCTGDIWSDCFRLPLDFQPPVWDSLRLDAEAALPHIGTAIVLMYTALEVFAGRIVEDLASRSSAPPELWSWVRNRGDHYKEPSTEEYLSVLLRILVGHSLKEIPNLWHGFTELRNARNKFVHSGEANIAGKAVDLVKALELLGITNRIFSAIRDWLPEDLQWPTPSRAMKLSAVFPILEGSDSQKNAGDNESR